MVTRPFKALFLSLLSATVVAASLAAPVPAQANGCALQGAGTEADPWLVGSPADFQLVGSSPCTESGHYLQTANITLNNPSDSVGGTFTGSYDGDHYEINLANWDASDASITPYLFNRVGSGGELRKIRLSGSISFSGTQNFASPLAYEIQAGGVVSEVHSSVDISSSIAAGPNIAGIALRLERGARVQYSTYSGTISWTPPGNPTSQAWIGGLVGVTVPAGGSGWAEIRDSYSTGSIAAPNVATVSRKPVVGGLLGQTSADFVRIIRSYAASDISYSNSPAQEETTFIGGLIGRQTSSTTVQLVSSFWRPSNTVTGAVGGQSQPADVSTDDYLGSDPYLPVAPGVDSTELATLTTFTSQEIAPTGSGNPGGAEITVAASGRSGTPSTPDYRWAIEAGNVGVFIPSLYDDGDSNTSTDYFETTNRDLYADTSVSRTYQARGTNVEGTATGYPSLGRVWEICSQENSGFPVLVWEERCGVSGGGSSGGNNSGGSSSGGDDRDATPVVAADVPTLAATGTPVAFGQLGLAMVALFFGAGAILFTLRKRVSSGR